ncbi:MAG: hypothetical protein JNN15_19695 [Blastocatellia bacterium]|nr:hypothetical protein [Blastocatellia bacterium]
MKRILLLFMCLLLSPAIVNAYTLVLKDGRRIEVREQYRIVNDIAVFSLSEGSRFSISLEKINIEETERANSKEVGSFLKNATDPAKLADKESNPLAEAKQSHKKLTNADFEKYRARREEMSRQDPQSFTAEELEKIDEKKLQQDRESEILAKRREQEKTKEAYWRSRAQTLLTQLRVLDEQINSVAAQLEDNRRYAAMSPSTTIYSPPLYSGVGISVGGLPIWLGNGRGLGGYNNSTVIINNQPNPTQSRSLSLQERLTDLQLQRQEAVIRYEELREEARRDGALPGWLR